MIDSLNWPDNMPENSRNNEKEDKIKTETKKDIINEIDNSALHFANATVKTLREKFWETCTINGYLNGEPEPLANGNYAFNIIKNWATRIRKNGKNPEIGQIRIITTKDSLFEIQLNPVEQYGEWFFSVSGLSEQWLISEMWSLQSFLENETVLENSRFKKEVNYDPSSMDDNLAEFEARLAQKNNKKNK